jgi:hypothetical protein
MSRGLLAILLVAAALTLTGCDQTDHFQAEFDSVKAEALQQSSAWDGYKLLMKEKDRDWKACNGVCSDEHYAILESGDELLLSLYKTALNEADPRAYYTLFRRDEPPIFKRNGWEKNLEMRQLYAPKLLAVADSAQVDPQLLALAGYLVSEGRYAMRDYHRAMGFLFRAWVGGSTWAAAEASKASLGNKNEVDAYLWALRCVDVCNLDQGRLDKLEEGLDAATIIKAQKAAPDKTVATLGDFQVSKK